VMWLAGLHGAAIGTKEEGWSPPAQ